MKRLLPILVLVGLVLSACDGPTNPTSPEMEAPVAAAGSGGSAGALLSSEANVSHRFERTTGKPTLETIEFELPESDQVTGYQLKLVARANDEDEPLERSEVWLDGERILVKKEMTGAGTVTLELAPGPHTLGAQLWGPPGTAIEIGVFAGLKAVAEVTIDPAEVELQPGASALLQAVVTAADGTILTDREITWSVDASGVIELGDATSAEVQASALAAGSVIVSATSEGVTGTAAIEVATPGFSFLIGDEIRGVQINQDGSATVAGAFQSDLGAGTSIRSAGRRDGFVARIESDESLGWVTHLTSSGEIWLWDLEALDDGGYFVSGRYQDAPMVVNSASGSMFLPLSGGRMDAFSLRLNASGDPVWWARVAGGANDVGLSTRVDGSGNIYFAGVYNGCCPSPNNAVLTTSSGGAVAIPTESYASGFLVKVNRAGLPEWVVRGWNRDLSFISLDVAPDGSVFAGGETRAWSSGRPSTFVDGTGRRVSMPNPGIGTGYLLRVNPDGAIAWTATLGNTQFGADAGGNVMGTEVLGDGTIAVVGTYRTGNASFSGTDGSTLTLPGSGSDSRGYLAIYSPGGVPMQATQVTTGGSAQYHVGWAVSQSPTSGAIFVSGQFDGALVGSASIAPVGGNDAFLARLGSGGSVLGVEALGGQGLDAGYAVDSDHGRVAMAGTASVGAVFGGVPLARVRGFVQVKAESETAR